MHIHTITCSDPREDTPVSKLVDFMNLHPMIEVAVQASPSKIGPGTPRRKWFDALVRAVRNNPRPLNLAMHVNMEYCNQMCRGHVPADLSDWFFAYDFEREMPVVRRWQINFSGSKTDVLDYDKMIRMMRIYDDHEFILQHNLSTTSSAHLLSMRARVERPVFSVLYDQSGGRGILSQTWHRPYPETPTGYSGGLGPENVTEQLDKIATVAGRESVWIDAEGALKTPGTKTFDIDRAREYVTAARRWNTRNVR